MTNSFTQIFGGNTIYPSDVSYLPLALDGNTTLSWPQDSNSANVVARIIDITPSGPYAVTLSDTQSVSVGTTILFNNLGPSTVTIKKADGNTLVSLGAGEQWQAYLINNSTAAGTWRTFRYGAATAQAQASALAGPGLLAVGSYLAQNYSTVSVSTSPYSLTTFGRASTYVWTGGVGTIELPSAASSGSGWFVLLRNAGEGSLTIDPSGSEQINSASTLVMQPGDSATVVTDGTAWYTIGFGQKSVFAFDYTTIAITGGTYTLTGSELNRIAYKFTGTLTSNATIVVPATIQQYWVNNATTGSFTLSVEVAGSATSATVPQGTTTILYSDGVSVVSATTSASFTGVLGILQGGTGATNAASARTNLGATAIGSAVFTAATGAAARSATGAAASGANTDITSLSGLTTALSVGQGGTGQTALTAGYVVKGNGTSALSSSIIYDSGTGVGIGTTSPGVELDVIGEVRSTGFRATGTTAFNPQTSMTSYTADATGGYYIFYKGRAGGTTSQNGDTLGTMLWYGFDTANATTAAASIAVSQTATAGSGTVPSALIFSNGANLERMRLDNSGNVGIGTSSPSYLLHLNQNGNTQAWISATNAGSNSAGIGLENQGQRNWQIWADRTNDALQFGNNNRTTVVLGLSPSGALTSGNLADAVGYKGLPQNARTSSYTLALSDMGKHVSITTGGVVIPANASVAFPVGSAISIYNDSSSNQTISITSDTLYLAGTATTGSRTLAQRGFATVVKVNSTTWIISGAGVS